MNIGDRLSLSFTFKSKDLTSRFREKVKTVSIQAEARWKKGEDDATVLGLMYEQITDAQKETLLEFLYDNLQIS